MSTNKPEAQLTGEVLDTCIIQNDETDSWHLALIFTDGGCLHLTSNLQVAVNGLLGNRITDWRGRILRIAISEVEVSNTPDW